MQSAFSYSELEKLLETHGFLIYELLTPDDIQRDVIDRAGADLKERKPLYDNRAVSGKGRCYSQAVFPISARLAGIVALKGAARLRHTLLPAEYIRDRLPQESLSPQKL